MAEGNIDMPTGLYWKGKKTEVERTALPFQTIETVNESRATREKEKGSFFRTAPDASWYNRLIWGDNKYIMSSLLHEFAGKIDLIYIDPPFATGTDFRVKMEIGDVEWTKEPSAIEDKAYRDTWGKGLDSYLQMMYERLLLIRELMSPSANLVVHLDHHVVHYVKVILDDIFGLGNFLNEVIWWKGREGGASRVHSASSIMPTEYQCLLLYSKEKSKRYWDPPLGSYKLSTVERIERDERGWFYRRGRMGRTPAEWEREAGVALKTYVSNTPREPREEVLKRLTAPGARYVAIGDVWDRGVVKDSRLTKYATEKPEPLLEVIIQAGSTIGGLTADFFCGSGTTGAVAEKLGRRWIMADLSRYAIHVTRKRLLGIDQCKPFVVQNLGKYERQYWQGITFKKRTNEQIPIFEYIQFILKLYSAEPLSGMMHIHGKKGRRLVHVGAVDAPVTLSEIKEVIQEVKKTGQDSLDILGWEWEMGLHDIVEKEAKTEGVHLRLFNIPRDTMDPRAVEKGDITFYELAHLEVEVSYDKHNNQLSVQLRDFAIPNLDLVPPEVRDKIKKWSDYIDYWAVDWDWNEDTFHNMWQCYRTHKDRTLQLKTDGHTYETKGNHLIMVKVIDIFGNDTTRVVEVKS